MQHTADAKLLPTCCTAEFVHFVFFCACLLLRHCITCSVSCNGSERCINALTAATLQGLGSVSAAISLAVRGVMVSNLYGAGTLPREWASGQAFPSLTTLDLTAPSLSGTFQTCRPFCMTTNTCTLRLAPSQRAASTFWDKRGPLLLHQNS